MSIEHMFVFAMGNIESNLYLPPRGCQVVRNRNGGERSGISGLYDAGREGRRGCGEERGSRRMRRELVAREWVAIFGPTVSAASARGILRVGIMAFVAQTGCQVSTTPVSRGHPLPVVTTPSWCPTDTRRRKYVEENRWKEDVSRACCKTSIDIRVSAVTMCPSQTR